MLGRVHGLLETVVAVPTGSAAVVAQAAEKPNDGNDHEDGAESAGHCKTATAKQEKNDDDDKK